MCSAKVYPVTALTGLSRAEKRLLIDNRVVTVGEILADRTKLDRLRLSPDTVGEILAEAEGLMALPHDPNPDLES
jgi:hypothetical protein